MKIATAALVSLAASTAHAFTLIPSSSSTTSSIALSMSSEAAKTAESVAAPPQDIAPPSQGGAMQTAADAAAASAPPPQAMPARPTYEEEYWSKYRSDTYYKSMEASDDGSHQPVMVKYPKPLSETWDKAYNQ